MTATAARRRGRPRAFDHDEARRLHATGKYTIAELARRFGVKPHSIRMAVDPVARARHTVKKAEWLRQHRVPCAGGCGITIWYGGNRPNQTGLCKTCLGKSRRIEEHGTETEYGHGCRCALCRAAATRAKRDRRERSKVPCSHGCGTLVIMINRDDPGKAPECALCARRRIAAGQPAPRLRAAA